LDSEIKKLTREEFKTVFASHEEGKAMIEEIEKENSKA
jgi:hypothetical protein